MKALSRLFVAKEIQARLGYVGSYCCCRNPVIFLLKGKGRKKIKKLVRPSLNCNLKIRKLQVQCAVLSVTSRLDKVLPKPVSREIRVWCKKKNFLAYTISYRQAVYLKEPISGLSFSLKIFRAYIISESILAHLQLAGGNILLLNSYSSSWCLLLLQSVNMKRKSKKDSGSWVNC